MILIEDLSPGDKVNIPGVSGPVTIARPGRYEELTGDEVPDVFVMVYLEFDTDEKPMLDWWAIPRDEEVVFIKWTPLSVPTWEQMEDISE